MDEPGVAVDHVVLTFRVQADPETNVLVGVCEELGVSSFGETVDGAIDNVVEATLLYLNTLEEHDELRRVFDERRVAVHHGGSTPVVGMRQPKADVAMSLTAQPHDVVTTRVLASVG